MYDKLLKEIELGIETGVRNFPKETPLADVLDIIIKIKTIQMMDKSAGMLDESKEIMGNL